ncbi:hypothetical protein CF326_g6444 [Tilletia indica]|nr:hypothetical protein CF326_g6444 [Tilletia indica]
MPLPVATTQPPPLRRLRLPLLTSTAGHCPSNFAASRVRLPATIDMPVLPLTEQRLQEWLSDHLQAPVMHLPPRDSSPPVAPGQPSSAQPPLFDDTRSRQAIASYVAAYNDTNGCPQLYHGHPMSDDVDRHPLYRCPLVEMNIRRRFEEFFVHYTCVANRLDATWTRENILTLLRSIVTEGLLVLPDVDADMQENLTSGSFGQHCHILGHSPYPFRDGSREEPPASAPFPCRRCWQCAMVPEPSEPAVSETGLGEDGSDVPSHGLDTDSALQPFPAPVVGSPIDRQTSSAADRRPVLSSDGDDGVSASVPSLSFQPQTNKDPEVNWESVRRLLGAEDSVDSESDLGLSPASLALNLVPVRDNFTISEPAEPADEESVDSESDLGLSPASLALNLVPVRDNFTISEPAEPADRRDPSSSQGSSVLFLSQSSGSSSANVQHTSRAEVTAGKRKQVDHTSAAAGNVENDENYILSPSASSSRPIKRLRYRAFVRK